MKRIRLPDFLTEYDMKRSTFERLWYYLVKYKR